MHIILIINICFVVYDNDMHDVVDSCCFDTLTKKRQCKHDKSFIVGFRESVLSYENTEIKTLYRQTNVLR